MEKAFHFPAIRHGVDRDVATLPVQKSGNSMPDIHDYELLP
jgi:hypothetical protein